MTSFFQIAGLENIFYYDCDGFMTFGKDGQKYIFFSELKSNFGYVDIYVTKGQIISSFFLI